MSRNFFIGLFAMCKFYDFYTDKEQGSMPYGGIVFAICKMFEQSIDHDIKEGFTKSIAENGTRADAKLKNHIISIMWQNN